MIERLHVFHRRRLVGTLDHQPDGRMAFAYAEAWLEAAGRFAISVSLPLASGPNRDPAAHAFFANLLPEGLVREAVARRLGLSATNDFALLAAIGGECAGALTVLPEAVDTTPESGAYESLPDDFVSRLPGRSSVLAEMVARRGTRLSLAGAQDKLPVYLAPDGRLMLPMNGAPSTHILKVPSGRFKHLPANEVLTLRLARALSLDAAEANLVQVGGAACALVRRYDRTVRDGQVVRLHQEDLCQALGRMPSMKYQEEGGPGFQDAMQVVREHSASPLVDARRLLGWQAFNLLVGNSDGHGKNLSLLYGR
ncbi:MAG TPA: type II toxin-antitoxin system HipA family toxin, partial [Myxococcota bacterium]|nr:type II toxin-antitoxin system HipA family toxin [Myxococcota bacterium]